MQLNNNIYERIIKIVSSLQLIRRSENNIKCRVRLASRRKKDFTMGEKVHHDHLMRLAIQSICLCVSSYIINLLLPIFCLLLWCRFATTRAWFYQWLALVFTLQFDTQSSLHLTKNLGVGYC